MKHRTRSSWLAAIPALSLVTTAWALAAGAMLPMTSKADLKWSDAGIPGVSRAAVDGEPDKGASHFYLRYAAGFVAPVHHHSPDHYVTTVAGNLVLIVNGKESRLPPGSYFAFTGKAAHAARCEGKEDCVMFIDARGPWDVVLEK
jgi:quercetin dioxygenase-like cupin family protein